VLLGASITSKVCLREQMKYNLRHRGPKRDDAQLCTIYDSLRDYDALRLIALYAQTMPSHSYTLRRRVKRAPLPCEDGT
jgi:hypothetical protein